MAHCPIASPGAKTTTTPTVTMSATAPADFGITIIGERESTAITAAAQGKVRPIPTKNSMIAFFCIRLLGRTRALNA